MICIGISKITELTKPKVTTEMSAKDNIYIYIGHLVAFKKAFWCLRSEVTIAQHFVRRRGSRIWIHSLSLSIF